ncbi:MAG: hypothetical protein HY744_11990 [Deltaproteobacteria bacterium]|nr:hypothetical protein [Deltaproteobacteria bacterium]
MKRTYYLACLLCAALLLIVRAALAMSGDEYRRTFLQPADLPGMSMTQDSRAQSDPSDQAFRQHGGEHDGFAVWMGDMAAPVWRLVDVRIAFPSEDEATGYMDDAMDKLSEGRHPIPSAPDVGSDCQVFGGVEQTMGIELVNYFYLFRVRNVVAKVYAAQGPGVQGKVLSPQVLEPYARKAAARIAAVTGGSIGPGPVSPPPPPKPPEPPKPPPPPPPSAKTVTLPSAGLTIALPAGPDEWRVRTLTKDDKTLEMLERTSPATPEMVINPFFPPFGDCETFRTKMVAAGLRQVDRSPPSGWKPYSLDRENGISNLCADSARGTLVAGLSQSVWETGSSSARELLAAIARAAGSKSGADVTPTGPTVVTTTSAEADTPRHRYTPPDRKEEEENGKELTYEGREPGGVRGQIDSLYVTPKRVGDSAYDPFLNIVVGLEGGPIASDDLDDVLGVALDYGLSFGFNTQKNVPFDLHFGLGPGVRLGPLVLAPVLGGGIDALGAGPDDTFQMSGAFYWYLGGRLRVGISKYAIEGYAARTFRGSLMGDVASDVTNQSRLVVRAARLIENDEQEISLGFLLTDFEDRARGYGGCLSYGLVVED